MNPSMTPKRLRVLEFIVEYRSKTGASPTLQEIGDHFGIARPTAREHLLGLEKLGCITRENSHRGIRLINGDDNCPLCGQRISRAEAEERPHTEGDPICP